MERKVSLVARTVRRQGRISRPVALSIVLTCPLKTIVSAFPPVSLKKLVDSPQCDLREHGCVKALTLCDRPSTSADLVLSPDKLVLPNLRDNV